MNSLSAPTTGGSWGVFSAGGLPCGDECLDGSLSRAAMFFTRLRAYIAEFRQMQQLQRELPEKLRVLQEQVKASESAASAQRELQVKR